MLLRKIAQPTFRLDSFVQGKPCARPHFDELQMMSKPFLRGLAGVPVRT
jgi:hypothetical protein